jgi:transcriptional regulator with XRE-family HTH domain
MDRATLDMLWRGLGTRLATYRQAAGLSQPQLARAIGRTRSMLSKIEHGIRSMPADLWQVADDLCSAQGALVRKYSRGRAGVRPGGAVLGWGEAVPWVRRPGWGRSGQ